MSSLCNTTFYFSDVDPGANPVDRPQERFVTFTGAVHASQRCRCSINIDISLQTYKGIMYLPHLYDARIPGFEAPRGGPGLATSLAFINQMYIPSCAALTSQPGTDRDHMQRKTYPYRSRYLFKSSRERGSRDRKPGRGPERVRCECNSERTECPV